MFIFPSLLVVAMIYYTAGLESKKGKFAGKDADIYYEVFYNKHTIGEPKSFVGKGEEVEKQCADLCEETAGCTAISYDISMQYSKCQLHSMSIKDAGDEDNTDNYRKGKRAVHVIWPKAAETSSSSGSPSAKPHV